MPKLLSEERLNKVRYISMADYIRQMDELEYIEDKMAFTTRYLLAYGAGVERDVSLPEAIHIAKMKIADASAKLRAEIIMVPDEAVDPNVTEEEDALNRQFMIEPVDYLRDQVNNLLMQEANREPTAETQKRIEDYQLFSAVLAADMNGSLSQQISELDIEPTARDVDARLKAKFGGPKEFESAYEATKPGLFSKMFGTSSTAYHNLQEAYEAFNNPDHALYGNMNSLDKAAKEYLQHCFPRWNPKNGIPSRSAIEQLSGTKKARALFSLNILKATAEQRQSEPVYETIMTGNLQKRSDDAAAAGDEVLEENNQFQQKVREDIGKEDSSDLSQDEKDYHANFELGPDEEKENDDPVIE